MLCMQDSLSQCVHPSENETLKKAISEQEMLKQIHQNLEEDNSLFTQLCDKTKLEV